MALDRPLPRAPAPTPARVLDHVVYLDHAATTPMRAEAIEAMLPFFAERFGNPSGSHAMARYARVALEDARDSVALALGCSAGEVVFTSGGTEGDNAAVFSSSSGAVVCSAIEHHAVLHPVLERLGRVVGVDAGGIIDLDALAGALDRDVSVVSVMLSNNEIGVIQPLDEVSEVMRERAPGAVLHTDAVQAISWIDVAASAACAQMITISAHKFGGPKGVGALVVRDGVDFTARQLGGGQERDRRGGTHNVAGVVAMAEALRLTVEERAANVERVARLRDRLVDGLLAAVPGASESGDRSRKIAGNAHVCFGGVESEALLFLLEQEGIMASAASSCASGALEPSHVLAAIGVPLELARGSLRLSLGPDTTDADIDHALAVVPAAVAHLREQTP